VRTIELELRRLREHAGTLRAGDRVIASGQVYTARDAAHSELFKLIERGEELPFEVRGAVIYYAGPTPGRNGMAVGSCGPTTSGRMDAFAPALYDMGVSATIGKGARSEEVLRAIERNGALYLCAVGGAGALIARCVTRAEEVAFQFLGCESVKRLTVENLPLTVAADAYGGDIFAGRF
jgi:fumarate hydratase subunit beta